MSATLPKLRVKTAHSEYLIDQNEGTYVRTRVHEDANDLSAFGVSDNPVTYDKIIVLEVGNRMTITHPDLSWIHSTSVQSIEEVHE